MNFLYFLKLFIFFKINTMNFFIFLVLFKRLLFQCIKILIQPSMKSFAFSFRTREFKDEYLKVQLKNSNL